MRYRLFVLLSLIGFMVLITSIDTIGGSGSLSPTLILGFLLLSAYCVAYFLDLLGLPKITGFIFAGLLFGPYFLNFYTVETIADLSFLNSLALAFIAFSAGGELKFDYFKQQLKKVLYLLVGVTTIVFFGVTAVVYLISEWIPFMAPYDPFIRAAISSIFGVIAVARSPSSTIAIISETKAKGEYTDLVLSVTIVTDVIIIILFGIVISLCQTIILSTSSIDFFFIIGLVIEVVLALLLGVILGRATVFLIETVKMEFPIIICGIGFMVIKFSHLFGAFANDTFHIHFNLEPLLICMAAGFTVQNFSRHGPLFLAKMERVSTPIYIAFFAITGASINIDVLKSGWIIGLIIVATRMTMFWLGSVVSGKLSGDSPKNYRHTWLGFITQAGVSLGLITEVARRFPEIGVPIQTVLIAAITVNQIIGPIAFKKALGNVGEIRAKKGESRLNGQRQTQLPSK